MRVAIVPSFRVVEIIWEDEGGAPALLGRVCSLMVPSGHSRGHSAGQQADLIGGGDVAKA